MIRDAPSSDANRTGVLAAIAPSINASPLTFTGGKTPGIAVLARIASTAGPFESRMPTLLIRRHDIEWNLCVFEPRVEQICLDHTTQLARIDNMSLMSDEAKGARQAKWKNVRAPRQSCGTHVYDVV